MSQFKHRIRELRKEAGLTSTALAAKHGLSEATVRMWETGRSYPRMDILLQFVVDFNCSMDYLLGITDIRTTQETHKDKMIQEQQRTINELSEKLNTIKSII